VPGTFSLKATGAGMIERSPSVYDGYYAALTDRLNKPRRSRPLLVVLIIHSCRS
jgi:hypothetical protein